LKGRYEFNRLTPDRLEKAIDYFQQAIQKDPNYAQAYAGLADSYNYQSFLGTLPPREVMPKAEGAARKALELDENLAEPHVSLGWSSFTYDWDWTAAQAHFERALALNPSYAEAAYRYAFYLGAMGRNEEALTAARHTVELDPANPAYVHLVAAQYYLARQFDRALDECRKAEDLDPGFSLTYFVMGHSYSAKGMHREALASYKRFLATTPASTIALAFIAHEHARLGETEKAHQILSHLDATSKQRYVPAFAFAIIYIGLEDKAKAFKWLDKAFQERTNFLAYLKAQATFDPLRSDPRFQDLEKRVGL
jgi:tetratricopeptide (TPR) repeat protein